ncbi:ribokinase [Alteromonas sediminis]|uniref:Ribokinase n=1 Tax=Alteromonas sediminis TaxID=2259342 RepID=A0A3N5Y4E1_9ALTE|nr:ribokinase [Alteromonas sediminis]RPJ67983.1 ribokinase [Alteromonas sediminis]
MTIYNLGSVNIDHVYQVDHFVQPGETMASTAYQQLLGGKGANQSVALARAGASVKHIGKLCKSDNQYVSMLTRYGVDCEHIALEETPSGHAIIQVTPEGENAIVLFGGANQTIASRDIEQALATASKDDWLLLQNETSALESAIAIAKQRGVRVAFNPAPMTDAVKELPLNDIDLLIVNEVEGAMLTGCDDKAGILDYCKQQWPNKDIILTLGKQGVCMLSQGQLVEVDAFTVDAVDTTAAGDTFIGFFLAAYSQNIDSQQALQRGCAASAISVTRAGAAQSIPNQSEVDAFLQKEGNS